jgi:hypothetical protein
MQTQRLHKEIGTETVPSPECTRMIDGIVSVSENSMILSKPEGLGIEHWCDSLDTV